MAYDELTGSDNPPKKNGEIIFQSWIKGIIDLMISYENFYTDISCWNLENSHRELKWLLETHPQKDILKRKILFGTDWYLAEKEKLSYDDYCRNSKQYIDVIEHDNSDGDPTLWQKLTHENPMRFYGIERVVANMEDALGDAGAYNKDLKVPLFRHREMNNKNGALSW